MRKPCLLLALAATGAAAQPHSEPARCRPSAYSAQTPPSQPPRIRPLDQMPDARPVLTVYRKVDGCNVLLVREGSRIIEEPVDRPEQRRVFRP